MPIKPAGTAATNTPETVSSFVSGSGSSALTATSSKKQKNRAGRVL